MRAAGCQQLQVVVAYLGAQGYCQVGEEAAAAHSLTQLRTVETPAHLLSLPSLFISLTGLP